MVEEKMSRQKLDEIHRDMDDAAKNLCALCDKHNISPDAVAMNMTVSLYRYGMEKTRSIRQKEVAEKAKVAMENSAAFQGVDD